MEGVGIMYAVQTMAILVAAPLVAFAILRAAAAVKSRFKVRQENNSRTVRMGRFMSHRGGRDSTPENTMQSFLNSVKHVESIELDVWLTKDNRVAVFHDGTLDRMCGVKGHINDFNFFELPAVKKGPSEGFEQGSLNKDIPDRVRIPLFDEVIELLEKEEHRHVALLVEFKQNSELLAQMVRKILIEKGFVKDDRVVWFSLKHSICKTLDRVDPTIPRSPSVQEIALYAILFRIGLLALVDLNIKAYAIACTTGEFLQEFIHKIPVLRSFPKSFHAILSGWYLSLFEDPALFKEMKCLGLECWVLGVNTDKDIEFAQMMGADCMITDRPEWINSSREKNM